MFNPGVFSLVIIAIFLNGRNKWYKICLSAMIVAIIKRQISSATIFINDYSQY